LSPILVPNLDQILLVWEGILWGAISGGQISGSKIGSQIRFPGSPGLGGKFLGGQFPGSAGLGGNFWVQNGIPKSSLMFEILLILGAVFIDFRHRFGVPTFQAFQMSFSETVDLVFVFPVSGGLRSPEGGSRRSSESGSISGRTNGSQNGARNHRKLDPKMEPKSTNFWANFGLQNGVQQLHKSQQNPPDWPR